VEHGGGQDVAVLPGKPPGRRGLQGVQQKLAVRDEGPFGQAGGPPGEEEEGGVFQAHGKGFRGLFSLLQGLEGEGLGVQGQGHLAKPLSVEEDPGLRVGVEGPELGEA
jgi:hypothetical protein